MKTLSATRKAIEPDAISRPGREVPFERRIVTATGEVMERLGPPHWNPDPEQRRKGFTRNPETCPHVKRRMIYDSDGFDIGWRCHECGDVKR